MPIAAPTSKRVTDSGKGLRIAQSKHLTKVNNIKKLNTTDKQGHNDGNDVGGEDYL